MQYFAVSIISLIVGIVIGYAIHDFAQHTLQMSEDISKNLLILAVTIVWVISMLVSIAMPSYQVPIPVHGIMGAIVGYFFYNKKSDKDKR